MAPHRTQIGVYKIQLRVSAPNTSYLALERSFTRQRQNHSVSSTPPSSQVQGRSSSTFDWQLDSNSDVSDGLNPEGKPGRELSGATKLRPRPKQGQPGVAVRNTTDGLTELQKRSHSGEPKIPRGRRNAASECRCPPGKTCECLSTLPAAQPPCSPT
ncbi:hypothetical protein NDU88_006584 [Pleurodeles waltl]|uniref:Uncharacterized protein n=1 Tax=Pleurodeles waltl TaxID=8319 RepID=A0AAV7X128_PLEWA|nr:hypothetical protein NDU88_006584 [Pleurodeles waltl]